MARAECAPGVGFLAPGESALLLASTTVTNVPGFLVVWLVVTVCATAGAGDGIGSTAVASAKRIESRVNGAMWILLGVAAVIGAIVLLRRRKQAIAPEVGQLEEVA